MKKSLAYLFLTVPQAFSAMLYNGLQKQILSADLSDACDAAFNTTIDCPENLIQLVTYSIQNVGWNTSSLQSLCTSSCKSSLEDLATAVEASCDVPFYVNNGTMTFTDYMDFFQDKYELICLADEETDDFCLDVESSWNITNMVLLDEAIWPTYTNKCYYDVSYGDWGWFYFENGTCLEPFDDYLQDATDANGLNQLAAWDYYVDRPPAINDDNYGWTEPLEWDEYPLEMQCSSCFLQKFKHGFESSWGEIWDGITEQVWTNMQLNCDVDINIIPANNYTASENINITIASPGPITTICPQTITISQNTTLTCQQMAIAYEIPTAGIWNLNNDVDCNWVTDQDVCAPMSCPIAVVSTSSSSINVDEYIRNQDNFTMTQFLTWNPYIGSRQIANGDAICVGPPGGLYSPPSATVSTNSTYTTIAIPASPTPSGTATNCGDYYLVQDGDECGVICEGNSLTLAEFIAMNPSVNANCTNLVVGLDYCVATVNGTTPTTSNTTATFVSAPTTTVTGTTSECYEWHTVVSGDTCQLIEAEYGITLEEFIALNTYVNSTCGNIWPDYAYCVSGIATANNSTSTAAITATSTSPPISVTTSGTLTTATTSGTITTPTPTQTGMVSGCTTFYDAVSGDGCYAIATSYGITLDEFYEWNAAVGDDCSGLWPDYYYCVGI